VVEGLQVEGLTVRRGALTICHDVTLSVPLGEVTVLLGANGSGKSSLLDGIAGLAPSTGTIVLGGSRIDAMPVYRRAAHGLAYVEQGRGAFSSLTVAQNLAVVDRSRTALENAFTLFPQLAERRNVRADRLSGGEQQMLVIARALAARPTVLLLDQLSLGLAPALVRVLLRAVTQLADQGMGILLVEQFTESALRIGTTAHVMQNGRIVRSELCANLLHDKASLAAPYLSSGSERS
jgi:branched-chain amino acid transport system ATP-binding protein